MLRQLLFFCGTVVFVRGQCNISEETKGKNSFPNPHKLYHASGQYRLSVEVNDVMQKRSMYVMEYYNAVRGRVDSNILGSQSSFLYDVSDISGEAFIFTDGPDDCITEYVNKDPVSFYELFNVFEWMHENEGRRTYGPFSMLYNAFDEASDIGYEGPVTIRGLKANSWKRCSNNGTLTFRYFFLDESESEDIFGISKEHYPLRVTVEGKHTNGKGVNQNYEFMHFDVILEDNDVFEIPKYKGCKRLVEEEVLITKRDKNYALQAEVVYTPYKGSDKYSYVSNLEVVSADSMKFYMYRTYNRAAQQDKDNPVPASVRSILTVFDTKNKFLYEIDEASGTCVVNPTTDDSFNPIIQLPDGQNLSLYEDSMLHINEDTAPGFHYLGEANERDKKVFVFEKKKTDFTNFISTQYYLSDNEREFNEFEEINVPIKVIYDRRTFLGSFTGIVTFNIYKFSTHITEAPDLSSCFPAEEQSEGFQILFPTGSEESHHLLNILPTLKRNFFQAMISFDIITGLQIPEITVDLDVDYIYLTTKLLDRPPYKHDFNLQGTYTILDPPQVILSSEENCFKACLEEEQCKAISYCGANCALSFSEFSKDITQEDKECSFYNKSSKESQKTISQVYTQLNDIIYNEGFTLTVFGNNKTYELKASDIKTGIKYGRDQKPKGSNNISGKFQVLQRSSKLKNHDKEGVKMSYYECQESCLNDQNCASISYCVIKSTCLRSENHGDVLKGDQIVTDTQCIVLEKNFEDYFIPMSGLRKVTKAEDSIDASSSNNCAMKCYEESSFLCRSFDYCLTENGVNCFMHSTHILETKGKEVKAADCTHYYRNYIYDFSLVHKKQVFIGHAKEIKLFDVTIEDCAKYCAEDPECHTFDYCTKNNNPKFVCTTTSTKVSDWSLSYRDEPSCNVYAKKYLEDESTFKLASSDVKAIKENALADDNLEVVEVVEDTGYSKSLTGGISFFMFLVGAAIGAAVMFGYGYYRANRKA